MILNAEPSFFQRNANSLKGAVIFVLMLILLIPAAMIEDIIRERQGRQNEAVNEVAGKWGLNQTINGPVLVIPYEQITRNTRWAGNESRPEICLFAARRSAHNRRSVSGKTLPGHF